MNEWFIADALGEIRDELIEDAAEAPGRRRTSARKWIAAAVLLIFAAGLLLIFGSRRAVGPGDGPQEQQAVQPSEAPGGAATIRFAGTRYRVGTASVLNAPREGWIAAGTLRSASAPGEEPRDELQTDRAEFVGSRLFLDPSRPDRLWLELDGAYIEAELQLDADGYELAREAYASMLILHDGALYRYDGVYSSGGGLPPDAEALGSLTPVNGQPVPTGELETNYQFLGNARVWRSEAQGCLLTELPQELNADGQAWWRFVPSAGE